MAYNLKAGIMATTTMVGSAFAYTRTNSGQPDGVGQPGAGGPGGGAFRGYQGGPGQGQGGPGGVGGRQDKYQDTVQQMMHWKY